MTPAQQKEARSKAGKARRWRAEAVERKKWRTIVVDPPWAYTLRRNDKTHRGRCVYADMSEAEIAALPVDQWVESDAHLYLWTTNNHLAEAHRIVKAWGFDQKTVLTWVKNQIGVGGYYRNNTEHVLFAVKGKLPTQHKDTGTAFHAPRGRHSQKPDSFYDMVERMSPGPYIDVFARRHRMNWDCAGNEVYSAIPELAAASDNEARMLRERAEG